MRLDQARQVKIGQKLFNLFNEEVVVTSIFSPTDAGDVVLFGTIDTRMDSAAYSFEDVYFDLEDICDEERSFISWVQDNREFIEDNEESLRAIKTSYLAGFGSGFNHKLKYTYEEQMQK